MLYDTLINIYICIKDQYYLNSKPYKYIFTSSQIFSFYNKNISEDDKIFFFWTEDYNDQKLEYYRNLFA